MFSPGLHRTGITPVQSLPLDALLLCRPPKGESIRRLRDTRMLRSRPPQADWATHKKCCAAPAETQQVQATASNVAATPPKKPAAVAAAASVQPVSAAPVGIVGTGYPSEPLIRVYSDPPLLGFTSGVNPVPPLVLDVLDRAKDSRTSVTKRTIVDKGTFKEQFSGFTQKAFDNMPAGECGCP